MDTRQTGCKNCNVKQWNPEASKGFLKGIIQRLLHLDPLEKRSPDCLVKGGAEELAAVFTEAHTRHSFTVGALEPPQALAALDLPHLNTHGSLFVNAVQVSERVTQNSSVPF